jgi:hypothetical protein
VSKGSGERIEYSREPRAKEPKATPKPKSGELTEAQAQADISQSRENARLRGFTDETIDTFGLEWSEPYGRPTLSIPYRHHSTGEVVKRTRSVKQEAPNERGEPTFIRQFRWPKGTTAAELIFGSDIRDADTFILASGETDAMAWVQATGVPTIAIPGEGLKLDAMLDLFRGRRVYVAMDNDEAGEKSSQTRCTRLMGVAREVLEVKIPDGEGIKDAADMLRAGRGAELAGLLEQAKDMTPEALNDAPDEGLGYDPLQWRLENGRLYRVTSRGLTLVTDRPLFVMALGVDVMKPDSDAKWVKIRCGNRDAWYRDDRLRSKECLLSIPGRSVTHENWKALDSWNQHQLGRKEDAIDAGRLEPVKMASKAGWTEMDGRPRFIIPGDECIKFVGDQNFTVRGSVEEWLDGVHLLTGLGSGGLIGLKIVLGALGSPMAVHLARNPIFSLVARMGTGKGSVTEFAGAIWRPTRGENSCIRAKGSWKGYQDAGFGSLNNYPMIIDEFWKLEFTTQKSIIEDMSDGRRRTLALRDQEGDIKSVGGDTRTGVTILLSEQDVMDGMPAGSTTRVITFDAGGELFPRNDENEDAVKRLLSIARKHAGAVGARFVSWLNKQDIDAEAAKIRELGKEFARRVPGTGGELTGYAGLLMWTADAFWRAFGVRLPEQALFDSLADDLRRCIDVSDRERQVAERLVARMVTLLGDDKRDDKRFEEFGELVARRDRDGFIDVNPEAKWTLDTIKQVAPDIKPERLVKALANQGITETSTENRNGRVIIRYKIKSRHFGKPIWRFKSSFVDEVTGEPITEADHGADEEHVEEKRVPVAPAITISPRIVEEVPVNEQDRIMTELRSFTPIEVPDTSIPCPPGVPGTIHLRTWIRRQVHEHDQGKRIDIEMARHVLEHVKASRRVS